jgi:N-ethylmaleimide reductase
MEAIATGHADMIAFGRPYIANPDLVERLRRDARIVEAPKEALYGGGAKGYIDFPTLQAPLAAE